MNNFKFTTIANAKKEIGISYLGNHEISAKIAKNLKVNNQLTYALYLSPSNISGYDVCKFATPECKLGCLATSGHAGMEIISGRNVINNARNKKTQLFFENNEYFMQWLIADIKANENLAKKKGYGFSVRLNCTSDIDWQNTLYLGMNIFEYFPNVNFYDYTKNPNKFINKPSNYHLTFSYTGKNWGICAMLLERGFNIAMIFNVKKESELPTKFEGYNVINGDLTDYRINCYCWLKMETYCQQRS